LSGSTVIAPMLSTLDN